MRFFAAFLRFASLSHMSEALVAGTIYSPRGRASQCMIGPLSLTGPRLITLNFSLMVVRRPENTATDHRTERRNFHFFGLPDLLRCP